MNTRFIKLFFLFFCILTFISCAKDEETFTGTITGKVTDATTGEVLQGATVTLNPTGSSRTTGSDGNFEFLNLDPKQYEIQAKKNGYTTNSKSVTVVAGRTISGDIQLTPVVQEAKLELSVSSLNFGSKNSSLSFDIINNGNARFNWNISGLDKIDWLEISPVSGSLEAGKSNAVQVELLRERLTENEEATIIINADKESVALKITAEVESLSSKIVLSSNTLNFGLEYSSLTFDIKNTGNAGDADWEITDIDADWIKVSPTSGTTAMGKSSVVKVDLDRSKLTEGSHTTTIIVNADGESQRVTINAEKGSERYLEVTPSALVLGTESQGSIGIMSHNGSTTYAIQGHEEVSWIKLDKSEDTIAAYNSSDASTIETINVTIDRSGLSAGEYNHSLKITSDLETIEIPVTMTVEETSTPSTTTGEVISCHDDLQFTITGCTISGTTAKLTYMVENIGNSNIDLTLYGSAGGRSYIFDDQGNEYVFGSGTYLELGSDDSYGSVTSIIPAGVKLKGAVVIADVSEDAAMFPNITIWCYSEQSYLIFKDVAIEGRTPKTPSETQTTGSIISCSEDLEFTLVDCKRSSSNNVTISYRVKNLTNKSTDLILYGNAGGRSYIFDDQGNEYEFGSGTYLELGYDDSYGSVTTTIPGNVFVKGKIVIQDVDEAATEMTNIGVYAYSHGELVTFKNIAIR